MRKRVREKSESSTSSSDSLFSSSSDDRPKHKRNQKKPNNANHGMVHKESPPQEEAVAQRHARSAKHDLEMNQHDTQRNESEEIQPHSQQVHQNGDGDAIKVLPAEVVADGVQPPPVSNQDGVDGNVAWSETYSDDRFGSSSSSSSSSSSNSGSDADSVASVRERLLAHARATAPVKAPSATAAPTSVAADGANGLSAHASLQQLRTELLRPVMSSALTLVSATEESHDVMAAMVHAKMPPPPPEESKKLRRLQYVDHSTVTYRPIRKDFYVSPPDVQDLDAAAMRLLLRELDGAKVKGRNPPRPMRTWDGAGLPDTVLAALATAGFAQPFAVQAIGAPALMSGRDLLITAKTGSGKTLAYLLPLVRHAIGQDPCDRGEGPIGLILVPTHELAAQICQVAEKLCTASKLRLVASYGSTPLAENIRHCRAGCEVMVCTPGRLLDLLTVNNGGVLSLHRVSFVVVDEADRMFDSGFMEHVEAFLRNTRPDRQLAMVSATMPKDLRRVILRHLRDPIEITVGGKPTPASNVEQRFFFFDEEVYEVEESNRSEDKKFLKLLQLLGDEGGDGEHLVLIFAQRREECDELFARLSACGYQKRIAVLYSGMDPLDREFALEYFAPGNQFILIATGVAERGLDIPYLELVINYTLPDHYEAYVHRIGRTGRAGKKGKAVSFFTRGRDDDIAADLCEGLERSAQTVPEALYETAAKTRERRKDGTAPHKAAFYKGYCRAKRQRLTDRSQREQCVRAARAAGLEEYLSASSCTDSDAESATDGEMEIVSVPDDAPRANHSESALTVHQGAGTVAVAAAGENRIASALAYARRTTEVANAEPNATTGVRFEAEFPINDLPELVRVRMQAASLLRTIAEETGTTIIRKGVYYDPKYKHSHRLKDGVRPLYLLLIGRTPETIREAARKLNDAKIEAESRIQKKASALGAQL